MSNETWKRGDCRTCGIGFDKLKSTAKEWWQFCCKDCEKRGAQADSKGYKGRTIHSNSPVAGDPTMPRPTVETPVTVAAGMIARESAPATVPATQTTRDGGIQWNWPGTPKGQSPVIRPGKTCVHDGHSVAFTLRGGAVTVYGARATSLMAPSNNLSHIDLIIDASCQVSPAGRFVDGGGRRFQDLNRFVFPEVVRLRWPDMTAPVHVPLAFWVRLLAALPPSVCISCIGSHGRTGTAMAALLVADGVEADVAIKTVRDKHCHHAIETEPQANYIRSLAKQRQQAQQAK